MPHRSSSRSSSSSSSDDSYRRKKSSSRHSRHKHKKHKKSSKRSSRRRSSSPEARRSHRRRSPETSRRKAPKSSPPPPVPKRVEEDISEADRLRRDKSIQDINSESFTPASFSSSASLKKPSKEQSSGSFDFGTLPEKNLVGGLLSNGGLAHPRFFAESEAREEKWLKRLFQLRKELSNS